MLGGFPSEATSGQGWNDPAAGVSGPDQQHWRDEVTLGRYLFARLLACVMLFVAAPQPAVAAGLGDPPPGFTSATARVKARNLHYVRGGKGPAVILLHGFPEDWVEYRAIMPRLAKRFTVVAVDLPGIGKSAPVNDGYDSANLAGHIHELAEVLKLERPYVVGHDLGAQVTYAYIRRFPKSVRGAMILDVPMAGLPGSELAGSGMWHVGFMQAPKGLADKLVPGRQDAFLGWFFDLGKFTPAERAYYTRAYQAPQLHAAFEVYRAMPKSAEWNAAQTGRNDVPVTLGFGEQSFFTSVAPKFVDGYRAKGMTHVESAIIPGAGHYVVADNPDAVADLIERHAGSSAE
jgi:pimeloyl-ACP methyl ester carboxylesterase